MVCKKLLAPNGEPDKYTLTEDSNYPKGHATLDQILPLFLCRTAPSAHIAVVCGECEQWSVEQLKQIVCAKHNHIRVDTFCYETPPETTTNSTIYCSLVAVDSLGEAWSHVAQILDVISKKLDHVRDPNRTHVEQAVLQFNIIADLCQDLLFPNAFSERRVKEITEALHALQQSNDLPPIIILVHLPSEAFDCFETDGYFFPKQLEYVAKVIDYEEALRDLQEQLTDARLLNTKNEAEIAKLHRVIEHLEEQIRQLRQYTDRTESPDKCTPEYVLETDPMEKHSTLQKTDTDTSEHANPPIVADQMIHNNIETDTTIYSSPGSSIPIPSKGNYLHSNENENPLTDDKDNGSGRPTAPPESKTPAKADVLLRRDRDIPVSQNQREKNFLPDRGDHDG